MKSIHEVVDKTRRPVRILQYGEGVFLRAFAEYMVDIANEKGILNSGIQLVKRSTSARLDALRAQNCMYTLLLRGKREGESYSEKRIITCVDNAVSAESEYEAYAAFAGSDDLRFIISNTTEAGIAYDEKDRLTLRPPVSFPGKLTKLLYERFLYFNGSPDKGLILLPVELIERNGDTLRACCLQLTDRWELPPAFRDWLCKCNIFCNTLVDRIVAGYPATAGEAEDIERELGYRDKCLVLGEPFALWVIESSDLQTVAAEFPLDKAGLPVVFTNDLQPYRERKVRLLNGGHTVCAPVAYLAGLDTVGDIMQDKVLRAFLERAVLDELAPTLSAPADEVKAFALAVIERFGNPYLRHNLLSITLNAVSKFRARVLPAMLEIQEATGNLPGLLCFSLAALIAFYCGKPAPDGRMQGQRCSETYELLDEAPVLQFFAENSELPANELVLAFLRQVDFWGRDLSLIPGLVAAVSGYLARIRSAGMRASVETLLAVPV